jgi:hypothetical protein
VIRMEWPLCALKAPYGTVFIHFVELVPKLWRSIGGQLIKHLLRTKGVEQKNSGITESKGGTIRVRSQRVCIITIHRIFDSECQSVMISWHASDATTQSLLTIWS